MPSIDPHLKDTKFPGISFEIFSAHSCREAPIVLFFIPDGSKPAETAKSTAVTAHPKKDSQVSFIYN